MNIRRTCTRRFLGALLLGICALSSPLSAQKLDERGAGLSYVIGFPDTTTNTFDARFPNPMADTILLMIYSAVNNNVSIQGNGYTNRITPQAGRFMLVYLNDSRNRAAAPIVTTSGQVSRNVFRVDAKEPIIIYAYYVTKFGGEAFTPIPVEAWGMEYYASAFPGEVPADVSPGGETDYRSKNKMGPAEILIVSAFENTNVTIVPTSKTVWHNFPPMTVKLNENEAYQVQSFVDTIQSHAGEPQPDIGGVYITADKPIGVVSGNSRAQLNPNETQGLARNSFKNMAIEWLAPTEQHGKYFVFMPTWDDLRIKGDPNEKLEDKRPGELVRVYNSVQIPGSAKVKGEVIDGGIRTPFTMENQGFYHDRIGAPVARVYRTDTSAQAFMAPMSTVKWNGTTGGGTFVGASANSWGIYMTELTPREQWIKFAPYYAPLHPAQMNHHVNIVTDTASKLKIFREDGTRVVFGNGVIPGTDLIWGHIGVSPGIDHYFEGRDSAKFFAFAYGLWRGYELYRPGKTKKKDDGDVILSSGGKGKGNELLHPSEYEENTAVAYGYPLAPSRLVLRPPDSLLIDTSMDCSDLTITIRAINAAPVGLRSITLDPNPAATFNAKLVPVDPAKLSDILGKTKGTVKVVPLDPLENAQATVIIKDRTGKIWRVYYRYEAEKVNLDPDDILNFGEVTLGENKESIVKVTNPLQKAIKIIGLRTHLGLGKGFEIIDPKLDADDTITLAAGASMDIKIRFSPTEENKLYEDTLIVKMGCSQVKLPLRGETIKPCVYVDDLTFGNFILGKDAPKTLPLVICNTGRGNIRFSNPAGPGAAVLTWLLTSQFSVPQRTLDSLRDHVVLGPNGCYTIDVTFTPNTQGNFRDTAQFYTTTDCDRDISIWTASVTKPGPVITGFNWGPRWNVPASSESVGDPCTKNPEIGYTSTIYAYNTGSSEFTIAEYKLVGPDADAGIFKFDNNVQDQRIIVGDQIRPGDSLDQLVRFYPREERPYSCDVILITVAGDTSNIAILQGTGIQSHVQIEGFDFGITEFLGAGATQFDTTVTLTAPPTRALTVTNIVSADPTNFQILTATLGLPRVMQPNETVEVPVRFTPQAAGKVQARILVIGDHSLCDDSTNVLLGETYTVGATAQGYAFGNPLFCDSEEGTITLTNTSSVKIVLDGFRLVETGGTNFFSMIDIPQLGDTIPAKTTRTYRVSFTPGTKGTFRADATFDLVDTTGKPLAAPNNQLTVAITGEAHDLIVNTDVDDNYLTFPGKTLNIPLTLDQALDEAKVTRINITVEYEKGMMTLKNGLTMHTKSRLNGWTISGAPTESGGYWAASYEAPAGSFLVGTGNLLDMEFLTYIGDTTCSGIRTKVEVLERSCVTVINSPGAACIDSVCGLNFRLIEAVKGGSKYNLATNQPNPFNPSTIIPFELGLDGETSLTVYNALGEPVATLVKGHLQPGKYEVTWDAAGYPSGLYYYHLQSGVWSKTGTMTLKK